jgi:dephospho-CoA kinase
MLACVAIRVFGLTGGIGSGKSSVAERFMARGLPVVDADLLAREVVEPRSDALREIQARFGADLVGADGRLDRAGLAARVFSDPEARRELESITHPRIAALAKQKLTALAARGEPLAAYMAPLFYERGLEQHYSPVVVVTAGEAQQIERASRRDGVSATDIEARLRAQLPLADKAARADYRIDNSGALAETWAQADRVLEAICRSFAVPVERYPLPER